MNKVAHYLQEHLLGEVFIAPDIRDYFSTDGSILQLTPSVVVYPRNENDIRKTARFCWQLAERGRVIPVTARGSGTDQSGGALGNGIILVFPAHMHKILELDPKSGFIAAQAGINFGKLQQTLHTHGRFLPPYPASVEYSTIGGAIGNNSSGEKSVKYGSMKEFVRGLRVVLSNGEVIETGRLTKRELNRKLGLNTFEGEIYRTVDTIIEENSDLLKSMKPKVTKYTSGYNIFDVKSKNGFDLSPLFVGSQGTLGIVSEALLDTEPYNPDTTVIAASFESIEKAILTVKELKKLSEVPSAIEMVDSELLDFVNATNPNLLKGIIEPPFRPVSLIIEFDNYNLRTQKRMMKKAKKICEKYSASYLSEHEEEARERLWKVRHSAALFMVSKSDTGAVALPFIEDAVVPIDSLEAFINGVREMLKRHSLTAPMWGHIGEGNLHIHPILNLGQVGDRQKLFRVMDEYYTMVISMGGSIAGEHNDGRLRAPYAKQAAGEQLYALYEKIKSVFDPHGILNPGVKLGVTNDDIRPLLRQEYSMRKAFDHMPRT